MKKVMGLVVIVICGMLMVSNGYTAPIYTEDFENALKGQVTHGVIDTTVFYAGAKSIKNSDQETAFKIYNPAELLATYEISLWVKTDIGEGGKAYSAIGYVWDQIANKPITLVKVLPLTIKQTQDWTLVKSEVLVIPTDVTRGPFLYFNIGGAYPNSTIWVDDISISVVRTREQNKTYYQNAGPELKDEAATFYASLYYQVEPDWTKAESYVRVVFGDSLKLANCQVRNADNMPFATAGEKKAKADKYREALTTINIALDATSDDELVSALGQLSQKIIKIKLPQVE